MSADLCEEKSAPGIDPASIVQALMNASPEAVALVDAVGIVRGWSPGAAAIFGYRPEQIVGQSVDSFVPLNEALQVGAFLQRLGGGESVKPYEATRLTEGNERITVQVSLTPVTASDGSVSGVLAFMNDVSGRRKAEDTVRAIEADAHGRTVTIETANRIAVDIMFSRTGVEALRSIADAARVLVGARYAALGVARLDEQGQQELEIFVTVGITPQEQARIGPLPRGRGILGLLLQRTEPLRIDSLADHPASVGFPANHPPMSSFLGVPIRRGNEVMGSLYLTDKQGGVPFTVSDEVAVQALGAYIGIAINNYRMIARQQALTRSLLTAQEEERLAVASDLHDGLTQYIMGAHAHLQAFQRAQREGNDDKAARDIDAGLGYLKEAVVESRRMVSNLRLLVLDDLGLAGALGQLLQEEAARANWSDFVLELNFENERFERTLETAAYRIVQEALTNVRKHAAASRVRVTLRHEADKNGQSFLELNVRDWGHGFVPAERSTRAEHVGLQGIIERVQFLNGAYDLQTEPEEGTMLAVRLPIVASTTDTVVAVPQGGTT